MLAGTGSALAWAAMVKGPALSTGGPVEGARVEGAEAQAPAPMLKNMGGEPPGFGHRSRAGKFDILEHCRGLGLGAVRMGLPSTDEAIRQLRKKIESYGMRVIISLPPPKEQGAVAAYETAVRAVSELGAVTTHASFTARRYEEFDTFEAFKASFERHQRSVELAEPILRKHKVRLAIENHKGWRAAEHVAWIRRLGSEWVGACYDFGNNISLCEDPAETLRLLAPVTIYVSFKDMAVEPYDEGFLLSEVALGDGMLDLPGMVKVLQQKDPNMIFALEMITREPLKIPVFTSKYWATFDDGFSPLPGRDLARILGIVRTPPKKPLTRTAGLSPAEALELEDELINRSIAWARQNLNL
jgi:sugar phosphate isomerase/epimerase